MAESRSWATASSFQMTYARIRPAPGWDQQWQPGSRLAQYRLRNQVRSHMGLNEPGMLKRGV
eukprot:scaffold183498_cov37-Tisochrysis_lutea.AAC.3